MSVKTKLVEKTCVLTVIFITVFVQTYATLTFKIGGIFDVYRPEQDLAFKLAANLMNDMNQNSHFNLEAFTVQDNIDDTLRVSWATCALMNVGIVGLFGPSSKRTSAYVQSICDDKEMPHIETHWNSNQESRNSVVNLHPYPPVLERVIIDILKELEWDKFTIIYENEESLFMLNELLMYETSGIVSLRKMERDNSNTYRSMLNDVKKAEECQFIVVCSVEVLQEFLKQAQQIGLVTEKQHYIIYNLDMDTLDLEPYQYGGGNITGIRIVNPENPNVTGVSEILVSQNCPHCKWPNTATGGGGKLSLQVALVMDAVKLLYETLKDLCSMKHISEKSLDCHDTNSWEHGYSIINYMKAKSINGLTGNIKFDTEGFRSDFDVEIVDLTSDGLTAIGTWNATHGLKINRPANEMNESSDIGSITHKSFIVITALTPPYAMLKETTTKLSGNDRFEGLGIDLVHELSLMLGFNYTFVIQEDGSNGNYDRVLRTWTGMIGEVVNGRSHFAIGDLTITSERESAVDFTMPFMNLGISILYRKPEPVPPSLFMFASPFSATVWLLLGVAYCFVSLSLFVMGRLCPSEWINPYPCVEEPEFLINQFSLRNSLWFTIGSLMQQGTEIAPIGYSTRMLSGVWWFFTLIMVSSYTANLAAFLTVETLVTPFKSIDELARQTEIKYGAKTDGATANFFRDSDKETHRTIWSYMYKHKNLMTSDNEDGVKRVLNENYAFLMESTTIEYVTERHCTLAQIGGLLDDKGYGIAMKKGSEYRGILNPAILKLQETGTLTTLKIKWWKENRGGGNCGSGSAGGAATPLSLQNVGGVFLVLVVGSILGLLGTLVELAVHTLKRSYKEKFDFKQEMKKEVKFFVKFKTTAKPTRKITIIDDRDSDICVSSLNNRINHEKSNKKS